MENKMFTILTPTYNRKDLLCRVFQNLKNQTDLDFKWFIIDNHSTDGTKEMVEKWLKQKNPFEINYIYHEKNEGYTYSQRELYEKADTKYTIKCDDDDEFLPNMVEEIKKIWLEIEKENRNDIAAVRVLSKYQDGRISGRIKKNQYGMKFDSDYISENILKNLKMENLSSLRLDYFRSINPFQTPLNWYGRKLSAVYDSITWIKLAKKYKTRYYYIPLRIYNNNSISLSRPDKNKNFMQGRVDSVYSAVKIINLLYDIAPLKILYKNLILASVFSIQTKLPYIKVMNEIESKMYRIFMFLLWPLAYIYAKYLYYIKGKKCF